MTDQPTASRPRGMPADTPDYMAPAWVGCLSWAAGNDEIIDRFIAETGFNWRPATNPIDKAIDEACGMPEKFYDAFAAWVNETLWGTMDGEMEN